MAVPAPLARRNRVRFLAVAAAIVAVGGLAAYALNRPSNLQQVGAADESQDMVPSTIATPTDNKKAGVVEPDDPMNSLIPTPIEAADFGPLNLRYLPSAESGYVVASGDHVLLSEAELRPPVAIPIRTQSATMRAADPADRRGILSVTSTFADAATADLVIAAEPMPQDTVGDLMDFDGIQGSWQEQQGFAPFSAAHPMRTIALAQVRIGESIVVEVAAVDVTRGEIEALIGSLEFDDGGTLQTPTAPDGFVSAEPVDGASVAPTEHSASSAYLAMRLVGRNGEQIELALLPKVAGNQSASQFTSEGGEGWTNTGLFGETIVTIAGTDAVFVLTNYDGQVSEDELIALAATFEKVDDTTWIERLAIVPLYKNPVMG